MKFLVVGDFHGTINRKFFSNLIKNKKIDAVISNGDYLPFSYRKIWFKYCYRTGRDLWEFIGKKRYKELVEKDFNMGEKVLKVLNSFGIPVITVLGNVDYPSPNDILDEKNSKKTIWKWEESRLNYFAELIKKYKNIHRCDYSYFKLDDFVFIGARGHSTRGRVKSKAYKKHKNILDKLFKKFRKENSKNKLIFISHNVPYNTKLDLISKNAHVAVAGKHLGGKMIRRVILRHQPLVHIAGHIHESKGKDYLGKTLLINPGAFHEGNYAILEINKNLFGRNRLKVKFY